ncbi:ankyrin repeat-containing domain protein [Hypoxylon cercidicola]|nr:ankyrin repeat-containing domain protein [Hypoxylon cercidicola]
MSSLDDKARSHININAENRGAGSQNIHDGSGDQIVVTDNGQLYKNGPQFNIKIRDILFNGSGSYAQRPDYADIVAWLMHQPTQTPLNFHPYHNELLRQVAQGTGEWILDTDEVLAWKDVSTPSRFLWMRGMPGSGKTMLSSLIINSLQKGSGGDAVCVYFYFQEKEEDNISFAHIWATLLIQLLRASGDVKGELKAKFEDSLQGSTQLYPYEYLELFKARAATFKTVYLVIDALGSCQNTPEEDTRQNMREALKALPNSIRVLITSRNKSVDVGFGAVQELVVEPKKQDVETYITKRIKDNAVLRSALGKEQDRNDIIRKVTAMTLSSKMFLSARLHMDNLSKQGTLSDIRKALGELPDSAFEIFDASARQLAQKINRGNDFESCLTKHIFTWVIHAKMELTADQICDSFAIQRSKGQHYQEHRPGKEHLIAVCNGLVIMDPENETLNLVHKSVQTHLQKHGIIPENASLEIGKMCLSCLLIDTCDQEDEHSLLQYAAKYWWAHLGRQRQNLDQEAELLILKFLRDSPKLTRAFKAIEGDATSAFDNMTGLHAVVYFEILSWAKRLLDMDIDVNAQCSDDQTALHWAVRYGRCGILELLIEKSANPNISDHIGDTPLHKALMGQADDKSPFYQAMMTSTDNNVNIVKALVKGKARLDIENHKGLSPMLSAIRYGPTLIAKIMINSQDDVDAEIFGDWTSLRQVFYHGQDIIENAVKNQVGYRAGGGGWVQSQDAIKDHAHSLTNLLLERGVNLNRSSAVDGWTPLLYAAKNGDLSKMNRLLTRQPNPADVHLPDQDGNSPLWWAITYKQIATVQLLTKHGANVNERYKDGSTPLLKAVKQHDSEMVQLLIRQGANVNTKTESKSTLLIEATKLRDHNIVWVLLNAKAALDGRDASGSSALLYAVKSQDKALAWLLVAKNKSSMSPSQDISSKDMQDALELAMTYNNLSIAWLLCEHGASPSAALLHHATKNRNYKGVQFLIERGATVDTKDADGSTPLHYAVRNGQDKLTDLLASRRSGLDVLDKKGNTALILATLNNQCSAMQALLWYGASCNIASPGGLTALHHAAALGFNRGLNLILDRKFNSNPNAVDDKHFTALHHAVNGGRASAETVRMLVKAGANMEVQDESGRTPLMLAAQLGCEELVRSLLAEGANAQTRNNSGWTAINYARDLNIKTCLTRRSH